MESTHIKSNSLVLFHPNLSNKPKTIGLIVIIGLIGIYFAIRAGFIALIIEALMGLLFYSLYRVRKINLKNDGNKELARTNDKKARVIETELYVEDDSLLIELKKAENMLKKTFDTTFRIKKENIKEVVLNKNDFTLFIRFTLANCLSKSNTKEESHDLEKDIILFSFSPDLFNQYQKVFKDNNINYTIEDDTYKEEE